MRYMWVEEATQIHVLVTRKLEERDVPPIWGELTPKERDDIDLKKREGESIKWRRIIVDIKTTRPGWKGEL